MRHVLLPRTPATAARRMGQATAPACLIAFASRPLGLVPRFLRAASGTVNLTAVATAADQHLDPAASTQEQPGRPLHRIGLGTAWTASVAGGILPRHACSAPCGARRRTRTWRFRSAPCLPSGRLSSAPLCARHRPATLRSRPRRKGCLWICGQRKSVAHMPTGTKQQPVSIRFLGRGLRLSQRRSPLGNHSPKSPYIARQPRHLSAHPDSQLHHH
jgi:hypothetical protein